MFAVCSIDDSYENICVPMKWFKSINLSAHINQAVNAAELLTVFYSTDKSKYPDFSLPISKNLNDNDSCYRVRLQKFFGKHAFNLKFKTHKNTHNLNFTDSEDGATIFKHRKRSVMPKVYSELKIRKTVNVEDIEWPSEAPILPDPKIATRNEISRKMNAMNKIYIDLSEEELEIVQNLLQDDAVDNFSDPSDFGEITAANNTESTSWDAQNATAVENPVASNESGDSDATYCSFVEDVVNQNVDGQLSSDDEEQSEGDPTASNFLFTPPILCSLNNSVPSYLQRMDPKLFNKLVANTNQLPNIQGESSQNEESPNKDEAEVDADDLKHKLNVMHLHFPGTCVFVSHFCLKKI